MSLCSCHKLPQNSLFALEKLYISPFYRADFAKSLAISGASRGPTPGAGRTESNPFYSRRL
jgi:hypothetical protein